jgi:hypothetical protein
MNSLEKYNEMQESELAERNRIISQNGNSGLNYELEKFNTTTNTKDLEDNK